MNIFTAEDLLVTHDATLLVLRRLDLFDCHEVVFAILTTFAVIFFITHQYSFPIGIALRSVVENLGW